MTIPVFDLACIRDCNADSKGTLIYFWQGFGVTWCRTMGLMCTYFILLDSGRRKFPELFRRPILGPFLASGIAATYPFV